MAASQAHIGPDTPMGAHVTAGGATFRVWAPRAEHLHVVFDGAGVVPGPDAELVKDPISGHWTGFFDGVTAGAPYRFLVTGPAGSGLKRDPRARELGFAGPPDCPCIVCDPASYPWHDDGFRTPDFSDLVVYQLHVGRFYARDEAGLDRRPNRVAKLLDALDRVEYLADLGVNAVQPLPLVEFEVPFSLGYNGTDLYSPEEDYCVPDVDLPAYLQKVNRLLASRGATLFALQDLRGQVNQLKAFVDVCHLHGLAVIPDVVFNHAGGNLDAQSLDWFDFPADGDNLYFSGAGWAGGRVFAFGRPDVEAFLIDNARMFVEEYHADGLRFDEVTVIDRNGGWRFCQDVTGTLRHEYPSAALIAEYWGEQRWRAVVSPPEGMGFDLGYADGLREGVRQVLTEAARGADARVEIGRLRAGLERPAGVPQTWQAYNCLENHDLVYDGDGHRQPRIPVLAGGGNSRSWYARSRSRVANGLLLTSPGVPMLFMGQEFLQDSLWSDDPGRAASLIWWDGLDGADPAMADFHRCTRDLLWLRRRHPALRAEPIVVYLTDVENRVLAFQRWVPDAGRDVVVVASLREASFHDASYTLGLPQPGHWYEVFNSDLYDGFPNPWVTGNAGGVDATGGPAHGLPFSAQVTLPANGLLVLAHDLGV